MAFDNLNNQQLAEEARAWMNKAENAMQGAMRRQDELIRRGCKCGPDDHHDDGHTHEPTPTPAPTPTPTPTEPPHHHPEAAWVRADSVAPIASNFNVNDWLAPAAPAPPSGDGSGAFRLTGNMSHLAYDDPIVFPGQPGASHLHHFFGNTGTNAHSTYASLRASGSSTTDADMVNRSAYWVPALLDGKGGVKVPDNISIYYKGGPGTHELPRGLRMIYGNNYSDNPEGHPITRVSFQLLRGNALILHEPTLANILPLARVGDQILATVDAPSCWDGVHIDSPNHRDHLAYMFWHRQTGQLTVPASHPVVIPNHSLKLPYTVSEGDDPKLWRYSSDPAGDPAGLSFHADLWEAWDDTVRAMWHDNALDKLLNCSAGDLGNGKHTLRHPAFTFAQRPNNVPMPPRPA